MNLIEVLQSFINQIACSKKSNCLRFESVYKLFELFHISRNSRNLFENLIFRKMISSMKPFECFVARIACRKKHKLLANRCSMSNELKYFKFLKLKNLAQKTQKVPELIQSIKRSEEFESSPDQIACLKNGSLRNRM